MASSNSGVAVALLCAHGEFGDRVRESMAALGTPIVYEAAPQAFDRDALERSQANVVVVNLDARSDADFDNVYDLLDDARYRVVFNDDEVSGGLTGWDQARWLRHLSAKILGDADIDPPRPADAEQVPAHVAAPPSVPVADAPRAADIVKAVVPVAAAVELVDLVPSFPSVPADHAAASGDMIDFDAILDGPDSPPAAPAWQALDVPKPSVADNDAPTAQAHPIDAVDLSGFDDIALDFDAPANAAPPALPESAEHFAGHGIDLDPLDFDAVAGTPPPVPSAAAHDIDFDGFDFDLPASTAPPAVAPTAAHFAGEDIDFDSLDFESVPVSGDAAAFDFGTGTDPHVGADFEAAPSRVATPDAASIAPETVAPDLAFASNEWTLEDVLDDVPAAPPVPAGAPAFGIEKLRAEEFLAPDVEANAAHPFEEPLGLSLELIPLEEAVAPVQVEVASRENWLDPDAVQPKVRRVWVLGASIGGPEAVREFLAALPRDYPALFVLAQHLGDEFVDMMAKQLAQATALTVRTPIHGARVGHGEVVIVPNGKRMLVDSMGVVVLERDTEQTAFSPSINRVLHDIADRFGSNASAIIFSGMTDDAVEGSQYLAAKGGLIYAQRQDTSVVSTMIDGVCEAGIVSFQGSPKELAEKLVAG